MMGNGSWIAPLNVPGGSTVQCAGRRYAVSSITRLFLLSADGGDDVETVHSIGRPSCPYL